MTEYYDVQPSTKLFEYSLSGIYTIATGTSENKKYITQENGMICKDTQESFYQTLVSINKMKSNLNYNRICLSLEKYHWEKIIDDLIITVLAEREI